jgi:hypothetical protein
MECRKYMKQKKIPKFSETLSAQIPVEIYLKIYRGLHVRV